MALREPVESFRHRRRSSLRCHLTWATNSLPIRRFGTVVPWTIISWARAL